MAEDLMRRSEEGQTPIEDLSGLIPKIKMRQELDALEFANINQARVKYLLDKSLKRLSVGFLMEVHKNMFLEVWEWAGRARKGGGKNIGVPSHHIIPELGRLIAELDSWEKERMFVLEIVVRIHHRLTWIHPFENGNGRWARLICDIYMRSKELPIIEWPSDPKQMKEVFRPKYLAALKAGDKGDFQPFLELHKEYYS